MEGQYTTLVADYNVVSPLPARYHVSICNFAIMGTKYIQDEYPQDLVLVDKSFKYIYVPKLKARADLAIGNS